MRKLTAIFAVIALCLVWAFSAEAAQLTDDKITIINNTADKVSTLVDVTLIIPGKDRIVSVVCTSLTSAHTENIVALYDGTDVTATVGKSMEGEIERNDGNSQTMDWKRPLKIYNGCIIAQGAWTVVNIEFEQIPQP